MTKELEQKFAKELELHQSIIHKVCRSYTNNEAAHKDLFQEITIQLWKAILNLEASPSSAPGCIEFLLIQLYHCIENLKEALKRLRSMTI